MDQLDKKLKKVMEKGPEVSNDFILAIQEALDEEKIKKKQSNKKVKFLRVVAILVVVCMTVGVGVKAYVGFKEYQQDRCFITASVKDAMESGYMEKIDMEYIEQNGTGVRVNSLMLSDDYLEMVFDVKMEAEEEFPIDTFQFSYLIYDENQNILGFYDASAGDNATIMRKLYREHNFHYEKGEEVGYTYKYGSGLSQQVLEAKDNHMKYLVTIESKNGFPKSKKIYIEIYKIGYFDIEKSDLVTLAKGKWNIKIEVPDKFYQRTNSKYEIKEEIEGMKVIRASVSETAMTVEIEIDNFGTPDEEGNLCLKSEMITLVDSNGKKYQMEGNWWIVGNRITGTFDVNKKNITDAVTIKASTMKGEKSITLIKK